MIPVKSAADASGDTARGLTVVHIVRNLEIGGLEKVVLAVIERQMAAGWNVHLWCMGYGGELMPVVSELGINATVFHIKPGIRPGLFLNMARRLRRLKPDVVHCHNFGPLVYGSVAGRLAGVGAVIYTAHGVKTSSDTKQTRFFKLRLMDRWVTVSENARRVAIETAGGDPERVLAIINGVDTSCYGDSVDGGPTREALGIGSDTIVFGIVARLNHAKDHDNLFRAFHQAFAGRDDVVLLVVGDGELREKLEGVIDELGVAQQIRLLGSRYDIPQLLAAMDVFVLSSYTEGLAVTLLEAHAAALPIVATSVGGNTEVVVDGDTGLVVPPRDTAALARALGEIAGDLPRAREMGRRGRERVIQLFSIDATAGQYENVYRDVLARR